MKYLTFALMVFLCFQACSGNEKPGQGKAPEKEQTPGFVFSSQAPGSGTANWCREPLPNAVPINADPENQNRRIFMIDNGPCYVTVGYGNIVASFVLKKSGNSVELFTSDNMPECLSKRSNFTIASQGNSFHYDNLKHISFDVFYQSHSNGTQIVLEMPPETYYGITARK